MRPKEIRQFNSGGFKRLTYEEALAKKIEQQEKKKLKPKSKAARQGKKKTQARQVENGELEAQWKLAVRTRDRYHCQYSGCRISDRHIHCHHINPRARRKDLLYVVDNGVCLCGQHHNWVHRNPIAATTRGLLRNRSYELASKEDTLGVR